jgi:hypothetical protein
MRAPFSLLPITLAMLLPMPLAAQEGPRVLFCSGPCFAVDAKGSRTPAHKGTQIRPGQQVETGPGGYMQVKLNPNAAIGLGERALARLDVNSVALDEGRIRMVGGQALGRPEASPMQLRTGDGTFVLRGADVEAKKNSSTGQPGPTLMKLNAGDARLSSSQGEIAIPKLAVQGIAGGRVLTGAPIPASDLSPAPRAISGAATSVAAAPVAIDLPRTSLNLLPALSVGPAIGGRQVIPPPPAAPVIPRGDTVLGAKLSGTTVTVAEAIAVPTRVGVNTATAITPSAPLQIAPTKVLNTAPTTLTFTPRLP